jgi:predicted 2-oxoglutarate/Fe(II)-dependent dioxygenase YbiX
LLAIERPIHAPRAAQGRQGLGDPKRGPGPDLRRRRERSSLLEAPKHQLAAGDRAPNFLLPDGDGKVTMFYDQVQGRPVVLVFAGAFQPPILPSAMAGFTAAVEEFDSAGIDLFCITFAATEAARALMPNLNLWFDSQRKITEAYLGQLGLGGVETLKDGTVVALSLDANQRVLAIDSGKGGGLAAQVLAACAARPARPASQVRGATAPVLVVPRLLDPAMCASLMRLFDTGKVEEGAVGSVLAGKEVTRLHHERKKRLDHRIEDMEMNRVLQAIIGRRLAPELVKAFNFQGFRFDRFLVCRYAADREDRFRTHRDNVSPDTADRRFAMTLNLNGDDYEGGGLVFPEYEPDEYKPGSGGAVVFSCSLLHEALPVRKGVRYALLTFLRAPPAAAGAAR